MSTNNRHCGIILHPTSFPSPFGIGDFGQEARETLTKLAQAGVSLWQVLPLGPTGYGDSPYSARSTFAGNEYLIDLRSIPGCDVVDDSDDRTSRVNYVVVYEKKFTLLKKVALEYFKARSNDKDYKKFCKDNAWWLDDYALYRALTDHFNDSRWYLWGDELKNRDEKALKLWTEKLSEQINVYRTLQFFFFTQWDSLHKFANSLGIKIIGDIPIFVSGESVDVWCNRHLFKCDQDGNQTVCAGVPPDSFSVVGQKWGNPVYDWDEHKKEKYSWWLKRIDMTLKMVDIVRIDHFRGFESYWEVPVSAPDARTGEWKKGPGMDFLKHIKNKPIIAENLGVLTKEVDQLLEDTGWPGMKVLQFGFEFKDGKFCNNHMYLPHTYSENCVAYTGTHDNQTSRGWFDCLSEQTKDIVRRYLQSPNEDVVWQMIKSILASNAKYAIFPMQDLIGLDDACRMNAPSTVGSFNWSWRLDPSSLQPWMLDRLKEFNTLYGRM